MNNGNFIYKSYCELIITSEEISPSKMTSELGIQPIRSFRKGDKIVSKHSIRTGEKKNNLWALRTENIISEDESISSHIQELKKKLEGKDSTIVFYKNDRNTEVCIWIWIETDNAGIGLDLNEEELNFVNRISNRVHLSIICKNKI